MQSQIKLKRTIDKLNAADGLIFQTEKQLKEFGDKLSEPNKKSIGLARQHKKV